MTLIEPLREPVRPMMARIVVVRPAPLRPSSVTTSPSSTWKSTPCSTCDSPYQALRPLISRNGVLIRYLLSVRADQLGLRRAHVSLDHRGILRDVGVRALGQQRAALQDRDRIGDA